MIGSRDLGSWLVVGGSGLFGHGACRHLADRGASVAATANEHSIDLPGIRQIAWSLGKSSILNEFIEHDRPNVIVYAAGITSVDLCESNEDLAIALHADAPAALAARAASLGGRFVYISTDHLWDGSRRMVTETDPPRPINAYARSKMRGEQLVQAAAPSALILRTNFFGQGRPWRQSLSDWYLERLRAGTKFPAFTDSYFTPISLPLLYGVIIDTVTAKLSGIYHACGSERLSKHAFAVELARWCGLSQDAILPGRLADAGLVAPRPADMSLSTQKLSKALGRDLPGLSESFAALFEPTKGY